MSYSTIYAIFNTRSVAVQQYRNSWGTGPAIWNYLSRRYLGLDGWSPFKDDAGGLWALAKDSRVPLPLRACHIITFDYALTKPANIKNMGVLVAEGGRMIEDGKYVNHFQAIGTDMQAMRIDPRSIGVGLNCTSVSDTWGQQAKHWKKPFDCYAYINADHQQNAAQGGGSSNGR